MSIDVEMGEQREPPAMSTQRGRTPSTSTLTMASTSKLVGVYSRPLHPTSTSIAPRFIIVLEDFLQCLVDRKDETIA